MLYVCWVCSSSFLVVLGGVVDISKLNAEVEEVKLEHEGLAPTRLTGRQRWNIGRVRITTTDWWEDGR